MQYLFVYLFVINIISIMAVTIDKTAARNGEKRISERSLITLAVIGGGIGMYITMRIIHHKTRKNKFMVGIPVIVMLEIVAAVIIYFNFFNKI